MACPVCGRDDAGEFEVAVGDRLHIECPRCGRFIISGTAAATIAHWEMPGRLRVAARIRRAWVMEKRPPYISSEALEVALADRSVESVPEKQNALLEAIAAQSRHPGAEVPVLGEVDHVLAGAETRQEFDFYLDSLIRRGLIEFPNLGVSCIVTTAGWEYLAQLARPDSANAADVFVAMSFAADLAPAWLEGFSPGISAAGYRPLRVDTDPHNDKIDDRIMSMIRAARIVVVDVTQQNRGAYFEAGFALGLGRPVIWTVQTDDLPNLHFDTRQFNHVVWTTPEDLMPRIRDHLVAVFGIGPRA